jgi:hypothetical protein
MRRKSILVASCSLLALLLVSSDSGYAQNAAPTRSLITQSVNENNLVTMRGSTRAEVHTPKISGPCLTTYS